MPHRRKARLDRVGRRILQSDRLGLNPRCFSFGVYEDLLHGRAWQREVKRLKRLGAPVAPDDAAMLDTFEEYGWEEPGKTWRNLLRRLAYPMGLVTNDGNPVSKRAARFLVKCRQAFNRGVRSWKLNRRWKQSRHGKSSG